MISGAVFDTLPQGPSSTLLSAQEAKDRLREIVEGFFFRRLRSEDRKVIRRLLVRSPPGLGKTREVIDWAIAYQTEQAGSVRCTYRASTTDRPFDTISPAPSEPPP
jgi:hypothetical protein